MQRIKLLACDWMWVWSSTAICLCLLCGDWLECAWLVWDMCKALKIGITYVQRRGHGGSVCACSVLLYRLLGIVEDQRMFWFSALGGSEVVNWERNLRTQNLCVCGACLQIGLDGVRMVDPSTSRTLRIYPLETIERWEVGKRVVFWFCLLFTLTREFFFCS